MSLRGATGAVRGPAMSLRGATGAVRGPAMSLRGDWGSYVVTKWGLLVAIRAAVSVNGARDRQCRKAACRGVRDRNLAVT